MIEEVKSRVCTSCKIEKEFSFFQKRSREKYGIMQRCKECENARNRENRRLKRVERNLADPEFIQNLEFIGPKIHKTCVTCNLTKEITLFSKHKNYKGGFQTECKSCSSKRGCSIYHLNRDKAKNPDKYPEPPEAKSKICSKCDTDKPLESFNFEKRGKHGRYSVCKKCRLEIYVRQRAKREPKFALTLLLRARLLNALKNANAKKKGRTFELLGCSSEECKKHIESQFQPGMTWETRSMNFWQIDHIIPCSKFNLLDEEEQKKCFHYSNLMPRWTTTQIAKENQSNQIGNLNKGAKILSKEQLLADQIRIDSEASSL